MIKKPIKLLKEQNNDHSLQESIDNTCTFPASYAQQRLWFLDRSLGLYSIYWVSQINGKLDFSALQQSFNAIIARHEVLRTCFVEQNDKTAQVNISSMPFAFTLMDLSAHPQDNRDIEIQRMLDAEASKAFDFKQAPLLRSLLLSLSEQEHILLVTIHHSIADDWSMGVFRQELATFYSAFSLGQTANFLELPIQYEDYAAWQREYLQGDVLERQLSYWKTQLADLAVLQLPTDKPRPKQPSYLGARETIHFSAALTQGLKNLSQQQNVTLFMTLLAAFQVLLHRYSDQDDIVVGTVIARRNRQELENLIGFFVNTLALRTDLSGTPNFNQLLSRVHEVCLSAYAHQDLPFEKLVAELQVQCNVSRYPLFQVMLVLQPAAWQDMQLPGLTIDPLTVTNETAKCDLMLSLKESLNGLQGCIEYNADLFVADTITRLAGHFQVLLEAIVERPETAIAELPLLTAFERHQLLVEWNATQTDYPKDKCIHQLFEEQVARTPDAIALIYEDQQLSYQTLNAKANQLAHYLQTMGVKPDTLVAICMESSLDLVICLLAILKAGGAYVPLDPTYPRERLAFMLEDTKARVILAESSLAWQIPGHSVQLVCLDSCWIDLSQESTGNLSCNTSPNNLAYVMYTSGSTGVPKGVMIPHTALVNHMAWMQTVFPLTDNDKVLQKTPFSFDASVWEFFAPLISGARLILAVPGLLKDIAMLVHVMKQQAITVAQFVPSTLEIVKDCSELSACTNLKRVYCGGEALNSNLLHGFLAKLDVSLCNLYGPTEACIDAIYWLGNKNFNHPSVPIGRPIHNTQIYILDHYLQPVPIGVSGEIHIGGDGLARGYLNRPELTAEKFIKHPFSNDPQARLYKTGDLARYLPDGTIEFLGRIDHQVKIRGFRIELGEIESVLRQFPRINEALVLDQEDQLGNKRLVAYLTHPQHEQPSIYKLRHFLTEKLPEYMVPSAFVLLDKLPLTPNGKIDRKALPKPDQTRPEIEQAYVPPRSPIEEMLITIWRDVLKIDQIGIHDNFFELGGHSLLAIAVCIKIEAILGKPIPVEWIFKFPTVSNLSGVLEQNIDIKSKSFYSAFTAFQVEGTQPPLFWLTGSRVVPELLEHIGLNQPLYFLNHQPMDGKRAKYLTIPEMASYYLQYILQIDSEGPYYLGGFSIGGMIIYEAACQLCEQGKKVALLFILDPDPMNNDKRKQEPPIQNFSLRSEYKKLKDTGYSTYFLDKTFPIKTQFQKQLKKIKIQAYFSLGKALPAQLRWPYLEDIYEKAILGYQPEKAPEDIEKAVIIHVNNREIEEWSSLFNGKIGTYVVNCRHLQLLEIPHSYTWLKILNRSIKECMSK